MDVLPFFLVVILLTMVVGKQNKDLYIIQMENAIKPDEFGSPKEWYLSILSYVKGESVNEESLVYSYETVMNGFSALLTEKELEVLENVPGHVYSIPDAIGKLHTTHSPSFLGLSPDKGLLSKSKLGEDVIYGVVDSGIWPESRSFGDKGMAEIPMRWKGFCVNSTAFPSTLCNRKLIGARWFGKGIAAKHVRNLDEQVNSPRDDYGHGTHTASTVAGRNVKGVDYYGYAYGMARGVAPAGRIAMYKLVSADEGIMGSDALAAIECAIMDGVDILSMSFGIDSSSNHYFGDPVALGAFAATIRGIVVVCSAGNMGPTRGLINNGAPWIMTVGASTMDREFSALIKTGDGNSFIGSSFHIKGKYHIESRQLIYEAKDPDCHRSFGASPINGSVVLCNTARDSLVNSLKHYGARAILFISTMYTFEVAPDPSIPIITVDPEHGERLIRYASSLIFPSIEIVLGLTLVGIKPAPAVASFSSRGPYPLSPNILKPDVMAPGVSILAAFPPQAIENNNPYVIRSGTSMACPHVAGLAGLIKAVHRDWSPAAIKSALMTTATHHNNLKKPITDLGYGGHVATPFDMGAGHVDPDKALDPGLLFDITKEDFYNYLCYIGDSPKQFGMRDPCPVGVDLGADGLNYPTFTFVIKRNASSLSANFKRTVTYLGQGRISYRALVQVPRQLKVHVTPSILHFSINMEKQSFTLHVQSVEDSSGALHFGSMTWDDGVHRVRSLITVFYE